MIRLLQSRNLNLVTYGWRLFDGLNRFNQQTESFERFGQEQGISITRLRTLLFDEQGKLWIGSIGGGLYTLDERNLSVRQYSTQADNNRSLDHPIVLSLYLSQRQVLWVGTRSGLNRYDGDGLFTRFSVDSDTPGQLNAGLVNAIAQIDRDSLWVGTEGGGLNILDLNTLTFSVYRHHLGDRFSLSGDDINHIYRSHKGVMWIGTGGSGVNKIETAQRQFGHIKALTGQPLGFSHGSSMSVIKDKQGQVWVATYGGGLNRISADGEHIKVYRHDSKNPHSLGNDKVISLYEDSGGEIWVGLFEAGLNRYRPETDDFEHFTHDPNDNNSLSLDWVSSIVEWRTGIYIIGTIGGGINVFDRRRRLFKHYLHNPDEANSLSHNTIYQVYLDRRGAVWVGTQSGLNRFDVKKGTFEFFSHQPNNDNSLRRGFVSSIFEDDHGQLWIGVYGGGLHKFNQLEGSFEVFQESDGLSNNGIYRLVGDDLGHIWISTNLGLSRFDIARERFTNFDVNDGLQSNEFNINAGFKAKDGELFFGGVNGINRFYPQNIRSDAQAPKLAFTAMRIFNQSVEIAASEKSQSQQFMLPASINTIKEIELDADQSLVSFEFSALDFIGSDKVRYAYKLEGFDRDWIYTSADNRRATYTDLPAGSFRLKVKASNSSGVWNEQGIEIGLNVIPPPWRAWWAYVLYVLLFAVAIFVISRAMIERNRLINNQKVARRVSQIDRLKDEFLANAAHELRTPINTIIGSVQSIASGTKGPITDAIGEQLHLVIASGQRLSNLIGDILDLSKLKHASIILSPERIDLHQLVNKVAQLAKPLLADKPVTIHNDVPKDIPLIEADKDRLLQVLHNLLTNGVKFTDVGRVSINAKVEERQVKISVTDTGIGIPGNMFDIIFGSFERIPGDESPCSAGTGLGLTISKQLIELHGGKIWVESIVGQGASFHFTLPIEAQIGNKLPQSLIIASPMYQQQTVTKTELPDEQGIKKYRDEFDGHEFTILIVDDEPINLHVLSNHLALQHYIVVQANNGMEALQYLAKQRFDLVILDVMMPKMSGYDVCKKIRETYSINELPVLFLTAKNQTGDSVKAFASGGNDHFN